MADAEATRPPSTLFAGKALFWLPWMVLVVLDLWSKFAVFDWLGTLPQNRDLPEQQWQHPVFEGFLGFLSCQLVCWRNPGTIWGLFGQFTKALVVIRCLAVLALLWFLWRTPRTAKLQLLIFALIFAGAVGNLYDNFFAGDLETNHGMVRDFLFFAGTWPTKWTFPAFNVADSCITVGAIGLILHLSREERPSVPAGGEVSSRT